MNRNDYVKLAAPMHLDEWSVSMPMWRKISTFKPFDGWASTGLLDWYDAYNAVKHDGDVEFHQATLRHAMHACAALFVMVFAQFGVWRDYTGPIHALSALAYNQPSIFAVEGMPVWPFEDLYVPPTVIRDGTTWHPKHYAF